MLYSNDLKDRFSFHVIRVALHSANLLTPIVVGNEFVVIGLQSCKISLIESADEIHVFKEFVCQLSSLAITRGHNVVSFAEKDRLQEKRNHFTLQTAKQFSIR